MRIQDILGRGVEEIKSKDKTFSHPTTPEKPDVLTFNEHPVKHRPRTKASENNSYT